MLNEGEVLKSRWQLYFVFCLTSSKDKTEELCCSTKVEICKEQLEEYNFCIRGIFDMGSSLGLSF